MSTRKKVNSAKVPSFEHTPAYFVFPHPVRPGSMDAYSLPSLIQGQQVMPRARPAPHPEATEMLE